MFELQRNRTIDAAKGLGALLESEVTDIAISNNEDMLLTAKDGVRPYYEARHWVACGPKPGVMRKRLKKVEQGGGGAEGDEQEDEASAIRARRSTRGKADVLSEARSVRPGDALKVQLTAREVRSRASRPALASFVPGIAHGGPAAG